MRRSALALLLCCLLAGCGGTPDPRTVGVGDEAGPSVTADVPGTSYALMLPSGRLTVTVSQPRASVPPRDTEEPGGLAAGEGARIVGVSRVLDPGAYPFAVNYQIAEPDRILGGPGEVGLRLVADGFDADVPDGPAVWLGVPAEAALRLEVTYDGLVQTVDLATGTVDAGAAAGLAEPLPQERTSPCTAQAGSYTSCQVDVASGYPYVAGLGWAPAGQTYAVLRVELGQGAAAAVTVDGQPAQALGDGLFAAPVVPGTDLAVAGATRSARVSFTGTVPAAGEAS